MSELEKLFQNNKASFDRISPNENLWDAIKKRTNDKDSSGLNFKIRKKHTLLKIAASLILLASITALLTINSQNHSHFKNLSMTSPEGVEIVLNPSLNKITLIQFWASGNVLCNEENCYYYIPAYEKYKDQGFEIYAISLDEDKKEWIESIEENKLPWIHVSDLKGWDSPICILCDITKIPTSILLDQEGNVIAKDLNAEILDATLNELLAQN